MSRSTAARARRQFIREHHPDVGGDPSAFVAGLAAFDRTTAGAVSDQRREPSAPVVSVARARRRRRWARRMGALVRRLPGSPRLPGARRLG